MAFVKRTKKRTRAARMSERFPYLPKLPDGRKRCRYCRKPVKPPKRNWCDTQCVEEAMIRCWPATARWHVEERDGGVCAHCGLDTGELLKKLYKMGRENPPGTGGISEVVKRHVRIMCATRGGVTETYALHRFGEGSMWDADHIRPVKDGGGGCGLDGYQTLCIWCHGRKTQRRGG